MPREQLTGHMSDVDLCGYLLSIEEEYGVRVRASLVPLARASGKSTHAITAVAYSTAGKRIHELESTQCLFPGGTSKTFAGAAFYAATQLVQAIDEWYARTRREAEQWEPGELTALESYIAGDFESYPA